MESNKLRGLLFLLAIVRQAFSVGEAGSCVAAGFDGCCTSDSCEGTPEGSQCYCDITCYLPSSFTSCCSDLESICPEPTDPVSDVQPDPHQFILYANREYIHRVNLNGSAFQTLTRGVSPSAIGLDFHYSRRCFYWSDITLKRIMKADFNGSNIEVVLSGGFHTPDGIAVDWITDKIYWTDAGTDKIEVYDTNRSLRKELISTLDETGESQPRAISVDPATRYMYWSDWGDVARIERASMDGTGRTTLHDTDLVWPNAITVDYSSQTLYWADAYLDYIGKSATDGSNREVLYNIPISFHPYALEYYNGYILWTDWIHHAVVFVPVLGATSLNVFPNTDLYPLARGPNGIHVVAQVRQPNAQNPCGVENGGCSHLCLLSSLAASGYSCACPDELVLTEDGTSCTSPDINLQLQLSHIHILDVNPYNMFSINCTVVSHSTASKIFQWERSINGTATQLSHDGTYTNITNSNTKQYTSSSILQRRETVAGFYSYTCTVMADGIESAHKSVGVSIKGHMNPIAPSDVRAEQKSPSSTDILWTVLFIAYTPEEYRVHYGLASHGTLDQVSKTVPGSADITSTSVLLSAELNELCAGQTYHYMIVSTNSFSSISTDIYNFSLAQTYPQGAPQQFIADEIASTSFMLSWQPVLECLSGGTALNYMLSCPPVLNDVILNSGANSRLVDNLTPATHYTCSIKAFNVFGSGPVASLSITTKEGAPGPVKSATYTVLSESSFEVTWNEPEITNGEISTYQVLVTSYLDDNVLFSKTVDASAELIATVENLKPFTPYKVTLYAMNSMLGERSYFIAFTEQGVPSKAPGNIKVTRLDENRMNVTWNALSLTDARGFIDHYTVSYESTKTREVSLIHIPANTTYTVIDGLDPELNYVITVSAYTSEGGGPLATQQVAAFCRRKIQLVLRGVYDCNEWKFQDSNEKAGNIATAVMDLLESNCFCTITTDLITEASFLCTDDPNVVVYQATVTGTNSIDCDQIISAIFEWIGDGSAEINIQNNLLTIDGSCAVEIESFGNTPECVDQQEESIDKIIYIIGGAGAGAVAVIFVIVVVSVCLCIKRRKKLDLERQRRQCLNGTQMEDYAGYVAHQNPPPLPPNHPTEEEANLYEYIDDRTVHSALNKKKSLKASLQLPNKEKNPELTSVCSYVSIHEAESERDFENTKRKNEVANIYLKITDS